MEKKEKPITKNDRRAFLKSTGKVLASASAFSLFASMNEGRANTLVEDEDSTGLIFKNYRIDVHQHILPPDYLSALRSVGVNQSLGGDFPDWSPEQAIHLMNITNIETAITSITAPGVYLTDGDFASEQARGDFAVMLARECNEYSAGMREDYPGRFGFFATLPMPLVNESIREMEYALDTLKADGVVLQSNFCGKYLGDPDYNELMAELNRRKAIVFVHPSPAAETSRRMGVDIEDLFFETPVDTGRAVVNMLRNGTLERYSEIRWILAHAGGVIPYIAWRLSLMDYLLEYRINIPKGVNSYLKKLYYDTALSTSPYAMNSLVELVESSQILFGTDWPFCTTPVALAQAHSIKTLDCFDRTTLLEVERKNSLNLFSSLAG